MKSVVIGLGYFGKIIKSKIEKNFNAEIITIDPYNTKADYKSLDEINFTDGSLHHPQVHIIVYSLSFLIKVSKIYGWKNLYVLHYMKR